MMNMTHLETKQKPIRRLIYDQKHFSDVARAEHLPIPPPPSASSPDPARTGLHRAQPI